MIRGDRGVFQSGKPQFERAGRQFCYRGGPVLGLHARLANNLWFFNIMQAFTGGLARSAKAGADPDLVLGILDNRVARSGSIRRMIPFFFNDKASTDLSIAWMTRTLAWRWSRGKY
jgi:3-hydroxyisobutyrate dehydrogenase/2-hydroxy-3-oxopropionate reductase